MTTTSTDERQRSLSIVVEPSIVGAFAARLHRDLDGTSGMSEDPESVTTTGPILELLGHAPHQQGFVGVPDVRIGRTGKLPPRADAALTIEITGLDGDELEANRRAWVQSGLAAISVPLGHSDVDLGGCVPVDPHASVLAGATALTVAYAVDIGCSMGIPAPGRVEIDAVALLRSFLQHPLGTAQLPGVNVSSGRIELPDDGIFDCEDGSVYLQPVEDRQWRELLDEVTDGRPPVRGDAEQSDWMRRHTNELHGQIRSWARCRRTTTAAALLRARRVPVGIVATSSEALQRQPSLARGFDPSARRLVPWSFEPNRATDIAPPIGAVDRLEPVGDDHRPLDGFRVLDLTWAWAGPFATTVLADLGAEVVNIEWYPRQSNLRVQAPFVSDHPTDAGAWWSANQRGKYSLGVNLKSDNGPDVVLDLAARSHVVVENFAPGVLERLGLPHDRLRSRNPGLPLVSMSAFGQEAPARDWIGYGTQLWFESGLARTAGPTGPDLFGLGIPYPDPVSGVFGALAALAAFRAGGGHADVSELEATMLVALTSVCGAPVITPSSAGSESVSALEDLIAEQADAWPEDLGPEFRGSGIRMAPPPFSLEGRPLWPRRGAPRLFEHTELVLTQILDLGADTVGALARDGAIAGQEQQKQPKGATS